MKMAKKLLDIRTVLEYDDDIHGGDEGFSWFCNDILMSNIGEDLLLHSNEIGDTIGQVYVREVSEDRGFSVRMVADRAAKVTMVKCVMTKTKGFDYEGWFA
jgi:hypothetical protein